MERNIRGTLQNTQDLTKTRPLIVSALVNTYFYEHTSLCSGAILLRSMSLLILKVSLTYLAGLVCVSDN